MKTNRLEAFSDGVIAIIITIMVLELKVPHGHTLNAIVPLYPVLLSYILSFIYVAIYWNNHHHLLYTLHVVRGNVLWANLHLLFWISLFPFTTGWMGENHFSTIPTALYGFVLLMAALAYTLLQRTIISIEGENSLLKKVIGKDWKGNGSIVLYILAIGLAFISQWISLAIYVFVALMWIVPDRRIENVLYTSHKDNHSEHSS